MALTTEGAAAGIETGTIYRIPHAQRHGRSRDLFTVWFGSNMMMLTVVTGALATTVFHLSPLVGLLAVVVGNLVGAVFMALHAAQGPGLGVPQMVQTRGQFGSLGAVPVTVLMVVMYVGFAASNLVLGGEGLQSMAPGLGRMPGILIIAALVVPPVIWGYRLIHAATRMMTVLCGGAVLLSLLWVGVRAGGMVGWTSGGASVTGILGAFSVSALWQIAYAPYVSDYSRYMPADERGMRMAFHATYWGTVLGSALPMALGVVLGGLAHGAPVVATMSGLLGPAAMPVMVILSVGIAVTDAMNVYCGTLSSLTVLQTFWPHARFGPGWRVGMAVVLMVAALLMALFFAGSFMESYTEFLNLLMAVLVPWTAINLVDYYLVRHGAYDVDSFFQADGGIYGYVNGPAMICYAVGIAVQVPFLSNALYTGPLARAMGGIDLSWLVGLAVTAPLYLWMAARAGLNDVSGVVPDGGAPVAAGNGP
ncbi:cytosine permease [Gluconacetobacter azotocaptans]|uniref:Cytosine permease n=1 Tax=Gluconacetobacter azotocaptans TaxID=142834 RepID=A0A7W4JSL1_9PROT|nr:cytosine permease [Gluconacetobacter azotocaptans]MBB2190119.1 cytosine permease [Gluconacetobacter azotocaptans]GBQ26216.1 cytosine/purines/uracil/thiamine/allantoin transporter [Gluconacetobacter azotocaptans DSM 13594]